jgi:predicted RNA-binding Zn-ribbon protein involved in translation (DUF1610 family)
VSVSVICTGCGKNLEVGDDYIRKKMRCPECGVIFDLPAPEKKTPSPSQSASRPIRSATPKPQPKERVPEPISVQTAVKEALPLSRSPSVPPKPPSASRDEPEPSVAGAKDGENLESEDERCPVCNELLPVKANQCPLCGYLLPVGKKAFKINQPLERHWEAGLPFRKRLRMFLACQGAAVAAMIAGSLAGQNPWIFLFPWLVFTGMTAFLFGSYDRIDLTRNKRGKVRLKQTWRICFRLRPPITHRLGDYEELATGVANDFGNTDWIIILFLFLSGVIPAVIWWFCTFHKDNYFVVLCRDHGYPAVTLYRGWSEAHAQDMAKTICEVTGLPRRKI